MNRWRLLLLLLPSLAQADTYVLTAQQWAIPRDAASVVGMQTLQEVYAEFDKFPGSRIRIRYPGGDEGSLWASELRAWLVVLGIPSTQLELVPGSRHANALEFEIIAHIAQGGKSNKPKTPEQFLQKDESRP